MRIYSIKPKFQAFLKPAMRLLIKLKVSPTLVNVKALIISIIAGFVFFLSSYNLTWLWAIPFLAFIRTALNALDGMIARETKAKNQAFGEVLNEFLDRLSDVAFFVGLAFTSYVSQSLALGTLVSVLVVSYIGIVGKAAGGKRQYVGLMGKADRMFWLSVASVAVIVFKNTNLMNYFLIFILVFAVITIFQRYFAIKKELKR